MPMDEKLIDAAIGYAKKGIPVFPLEPGGKEPMVAGGFKSATTDESKIRAWWTANPTANIGAACRGFDVLDVDDGGEDTLLKFPPLPETAEVKTPSGGRHIYFKSGKRLKNAVKFLSGLDYRADGKGYVVLPPSVNGSGAWEWVRKGSMAAVPEWLQDLLIEKDRTIPTEIKQGARNDTLWRSVGRMHFLGMSREEMLSSLFELNKRCELPLSSRELEDMVERTLKNGPVNGPVRPVQPTSAARAGHIGGFASNSLRRGVPTGLAVIDHNTTCQGLPAGQVSVLKAGRKAGKSSTMLSIAIHAAKLGYPVEYITVADLNGAELYSRAVRQLSGYHGPEEYCPPHKRAMWEKAKEMVDALPLEVYDATEHKGARTIEELEIHINSLVDERQLFVIDYAQRIRSQKIQGSDIYALSSEVSDRLSVLAANIDRPILIGSQVTVSDNGVYTKGGYAWEEDAGLVVYVRRATEKEKDKMDSIERMIVDGYIHLEVQRFGPSDILQSARWSEEEVRWVEL